MESLHSRAGKLCIKQAVTRTKAADGTGGHMSCYLLIVYLEDTPFSCLR